jgi:CrcB protein|tara:strand:+ start:1551 stop:1952 length:402 start_codon:yes stop_codon:yes gene_type:complete
MEFSSIAAIAIGGGTGAVLRYFIASAGQSLTTSGFPLGTLIVNILGCALIGIVTALLIGPLAANREFLRLLLVVGVLGGFTTFSTFGLDTLDLFENGQIKQAIMYVVLSNVLGILAAFSCYRLGTILFQPTST